MKKFYANAVIFFLKSQQQTNFKGIQEILRLIDDDSIPDWLKQRYLFSLFHKYGLNELGYKKGKFSPEKLEQINATINETSIYEFHIQTLELATSEGKMTIMVPLN